MALFDSVVVGEEWISEHFVTSDAKSGTFTARVVALRAGWDETEKDGHATPRSGLRESATAIARAVAVLRDAGGTSDVSSDEDTRVVHDLVLRALGLDRPRSEWTSDRSGAEVRLPGAVVHPSPTGTALLILDARPAQSVEDLLDTGPEATGGLRAPAVIDGKPDSAVARVISTVFLTDDAPPFVLVLAGRWVLLAERSRWPEGRWLAVDVGLVAERRDVRRAGELETVAAMLGRDLLLPDADGNTGWHAVLEQSVQHTVGVSKDLREGIRMSVEILANEVVVRRRARGLPVTDVPHLAADLTRQSLRFLYRVLFLLYAEASPELGVLPAQAPEYQAGYGLDRLRDLTLVELTSERSRNGSHLHESLDRLFRLVDVGHESPDERGLTFSALRADLFAADATALIDEVGLGNEAVQQVLRHLLLSRARSGQDRGFISYAELGINQLGAVYEGLMSYSGFIADTDLYEVAKKGDPEKGTWVVPADRAAEIDKGDFVRTPDPVTGEPKPVLHERGTFVFRLAGRERQQSASYYTPEVLTRSVVHHALAELLDQDGKTTPALDVLRLTVCEPALGSGAFAIEAVRQLAAAYLERRQAELGERIPAEDYPRELQRVKAHLALHQVYGVDLNATAVELAEVSLWLDTMQAGMQAPWFGLHLRRGNSLVGARRAVYRPKRDLATKAWLDTVPDDVPLAGDDGPEDVGSGVHHFLLPARGWGAVVDTAEAKRYAPDARERVRAWRAGVLRTPTAKQRERLGRLARRVETLWAFTLRRLTVAEAGVRRGIGVWGAEADDVGANVGVTREQVEAALHDEGGAYRRLRRVMDAWCALWSWPLTEGVSPPTWDDWLGGLEAVLGVAAKETVAERKGQTAFTGEVAWRALGEAEELDLAFAQAKLVADAVGAYPWLAVAERIAAREGFFHWELDFAPVFARGGFDLQVGNPPWVRPGWDEAGMLAEHDAWWELTDNPSERRKTDQRAITLALPGVGGALLDERTAQAGMSAHLGSAIDRPVLRGLQPDLYRCFMERTWRSMSPAGAIGLVHPESHFTEARAGGLRRETYRRLARHWGFRNNDHAFPTLGHKRGFGVHIYVHPRSVSFLHAASIFQPEVIDRSLLHDGSGPAPGMRDAEDRWDVRPHRDRVVAVREETLRGWAALVDEPGTPAIEARMLFPVNQASARVLDVLAAAPRLGSVALNWTAGWHESADRQRGYFERSPAVPASWDDVILQGPHLTVATPLFQQPNVSGLSRQDYTALDLERLPEDFIPRSLYQRAVPTAQYRAAYSHWNDAPSSAVFRLAWRRRVDSATVRSLHSALIPPGPMHMHQVQTLAVKDHVDLVVAGGMWASLLCDFFVKVSGVADITTSVFTRFPHVRGHSLEPHLLLRTLRLNCLVRPYAPLWEELYDPAWRTDSWVPDIGVPYADRAPLGDVTDTWTRDTPLRRAADRRQALVEIDAIVAVMLGPSADDLAAVYRTQFPVLQAYERAALYDRFGRQVPADLARDHRKAVAAGRPVAVIDGGDRSYVPPFSGVDREPDLRAAHAHFTRLTAERGTREQTMARR